MVKRNVQFLVLLFLIAICISANADAPVFGNSPGNGTGFNISVYNQLSLYGGAVEFTPQENINLSSVTLWLSGYNGQYGQTINVGIYGNSDNSFYNPGTARNFPWTQILGFSSPAPNDGSLAAFTFSNPYWSPAYNPNGSTFLSANTPYWLVVTSGGRPGNYTCAANWTEGGALTGNAMYNGSDNYNVYGGAFDSSSVMPAFTINTIPEPGFASLMSIPLLFGIVWALKRNRKLCI